MPKRTKAEIEYRGTPCGRLFVIPAHTPVIPADNLPGKSYWAEPWHSNLDEETESWLRNYGFNIHEDEVEDAPEDAELAYLGSFDLVDIDEEKPVEVSNYAIRVVTEDEAEELICEPATGLHSYIFPSCVDTIEV